MSSTPKGTVDNPRAAYDCPICLEVKYCDGAFKTYCNHYYCYPCFIGCLYPIDPDDFHFADDHTSVRVTCSLCRANCLIYILADNSIRDFTELYWWERKKIAKETASFVARVETLKQDIKDFRTSITKIKEEDED